MTVYDLHTAEMLCRVAETKGCNLFSAQERNCTLVVANKKKISFFMWQGTGLDHLTDRGLMDLPRLLYCLPHSVIIGYKRYYEAIDIPPITAAQSGPNTLGSLGTQKRFFFLIFFTILPFLF
jgi:CNH domain